MGGLQRASRDLAGRHGSFSRTERPQPKVMLGAGTSGCTGTGLLENGSSLELRGISQQGRFLKEWMGDCTRSILTSSYRFLFWL